MKAALMMENNADLVIRDDVTLGELGPQDVRVKIGSSGVCHSDLSAVNGTIPMPPPAVLGHEGAGVVQEVGEGVTSLAVGDHVILSFVPACSHCNPCLRRQSYLCQQAGPQAMSKHFRLDNDVPLDVAALIGCGVTTGVGASINTAQITPGSSVVVFGCGGVGISAIQGARIAGAAEILAVDTLEGKLEQAKHFGATSVTTPDGFNDAKMKLTGGEGFDFALECIGNPNTIRATYDAARMGGTAVIVGVGRMEEMVQFSAFELFFANKTLKGSMYGSANVRTFMPELLRLWKTGKLDLESMISRRIKIEEVNDAFRAMQAGEVIRSVIDF
jgi:S-(hydroxymethyl)glutathione dehydrogenase/alcohol dehydrogenase